MYRGGEIAERVPALHTAGAGNGQESGRGSFAGGASAPEAGFSPLYGAPQGSFGRVVGWFDAFRFKKHKNLSQCTNSVVARLRTSLSSLSG